jgi:hypothetical protein
MSDISQKPSFRKKIHIGSKHVNKIDFRLQERVFTANSSSTNNIITGRYPFTNQDEIQIVDTMPERAISRRNEVLQWKETKKKDIRTWNKSTQPLGIVISLHLYFITIYFASYCCRYR